MCGIAGLWRVDGTPLDPFVLARMSASLAHRGPDGEGAVLFNTRVGDRGVLVRGAPGASQVSGAYDLGLGHRRLAIIDLSTGDQPMSNADGSLWLIFNGEIYNYQELRADLRARGYQFQTQSDTEVIIH